MSERKKRKEPAFKLNPDILAAIDSPHDMVRAGTSKCTISELPDLTRSPAPGGLTAVGSNPGTLNLTATQLVEAQKKYAAEHPLPDLDTSAMRERLGEIAAKLDMVRATTLEDTGCVIRTPLPGSSFSSKSEGLTAEERLAFVTGADTSNPLLDDLVFKEVDLVNHPPHYTRHPAGFEVIEITEHEGFCLGNAVKYLLRAGVKGGKDKYVEDLEKAKWYIDREIHRFRREGNLSGWRAGLSCDS